MNIHFGAFTIALVLITVLITLAGFNDRRLQDKLILWPARMRTPGEYYRLLTSGFIHADYSHLFFNMFTLLMIGSVAEEAFPYVLGKTPWLYELMYLSGIVVASLPSFFRHRNNPVWRSLGASGGVSAVLFSMVYIQPWATIYVYFFKLPNIVFAVLYVAYTVIMARRGRDNVNHDAHLWGAVYGMVFTFLMDPSHGQLFIENLRNIHF